MVKVHFIKSDASPLPLTSLHHSGHTPSAMEAGLFPLFSQNQRTPRQRTHRAKHLRQRRSLWVSPHPEKIFAPQLVQNQNGSLWQNHRWALCRGSVRNCKLLFIIVLEKHRLFSPSLRSWLPQHLDGSKGGPLESLQSRLPSQARDKDECDGCHQSLLLCRVLESSLLLAQRGFGPLVN